MRKIKSKFLTICALFLATITCTAFGVFASIDNKEEITVAKAENVEVMNENWTATPTLRWDLWNSMYKVTLSYSSVFNPTATWANDHSTVNGIDVRDYLVFNGETLKEIQAKGAEINTQYPVTTDEGMLDNGATWNPVAVLVNTNNIEIQINRNYLAPAGLEFGIKDGFSMTNGDVTYQTDGDVIFKLIPNVSNIENVVAVKLDTASVTTKRSTFSVSRMSGWDKTNYDCYHIVSTALMNYGNNGRWLCDHFTYLNDYITVNGKPLAYWNTVTYDSSYDYSGAPAASRVYATPTFGQMYQSDTSTTIAVYLNRDWMTAQGITSPELGIKDGMLYVGRDGTTVYEEGTPTEVMNENWTATPTLRWDLWNSMYKVTLSYPSVFNPTATWANDHTTINGIDVRDYLVFNGETLKEIQAKGVEINSQYRMMIADTKKALPNTKIVLCEPFVLMGIATQNTENCPNRWEHFCEVYQYAEVVKKLAQEFNLPFLPLQEKLTQSAEKTKAEYYLVDGVHPNVAGATLIADEWVKLFKKEIENN